MRETVLRSSGIVAVVVTMGSILLSTGLSPSFSWTANALSNLGVAQTAAGTPLTVVAFNGGLIVGGLVGVLFAVALANSIPSAGGSLVGLTFGIALALMGLVGVFPQTHPLHFPVAVGFYLFISLALWVDALVSLRAGWRRRAGLGFALGGVNLLGWLVWGLTGSVRRPGLALPEIVGALAFSVWVVWVAVGLRQHRWPTTSKS